MTDKHIFAAHLDDERSQAAHPFWYRFGPPHDGVLYFTFKRAEDVPAKCDCGNDFYIVPETIEVKADEPSPGGYVLTGVKP